MFCDVESLRYSNCLQLLACNFRSSIRSLIISYPAATSAAVDIWIFSLASGPRIVIKFLADGREEKKYISLAKEDKTLAFHLI